MCFSATASFGAAVILGAVGVMTVRKTRTKPQLFFASIPLIFAVQQCTEGLLWLSFDHAVLAPWQDLITYIYLVFAMAVWPFWIPFSIWMVEKDYRRKKLIRGFVWLGSAVTIGVGAILVLHPVRTIAGHHHLHYEFAIPAVIKRLIMAFTVLYILATIVTPFLSGIKKMRWLGIVFLVSYFFAVIFFNGFVISVWCFFAAMLSFVVLWIMNDLRRS